MAATRIIEEETGTWTGGRHRHNGYCAGEFSNAPFRPLGPLAASKPTRLIVSAMDTDSPHGSSGRRRSNGPPRQPVA